jgi:hypothetical protein
MRPRCLGFFVAQATLASLPKPQLPKLGVADAARIAPTIGAAVAVRSYTQSRLHDPPHRSHLFSLARANLVSHAPSPLSGRPRAGPRIAGGRLRGGYVEGVPHLVSRVTLLVAPRGHGGKVLGLLLLARPSGPALACWLPDCFPLASHPVLPAEPRHPGPGDGEAGVFRG